MDDSDSEPEQTIDPAEDRQEFEYCKEIKYMYQSHTKRKRYPDKEFVSDVHLMFLARFKSAAYEKVFYKWMEIKYMPEPPSDLTRDFKEVFFGRFDKNDRRNLDVIKLGVLAGNIDFLNLYFKYRCNVWSLRHPRHRERELQKCVNLIYKLDIDHARAMKPLIPPENLDNRAFVVFFALEHMISMSKCFSNRDKYIKTFKMFFDTIPESFVTSIELKDLLLACTTGKRLETLVDSVVAKYEGYFPESLQPMNPRSLQHLCKCRIRASMHEAVTLPCGIRQLPVPKKLRDYVALLRESEDPFIY